MKPKYVFELTLACLLGGLVSASCGTDDNPNGANADPSTSTSTTEVPTTTVAPVNPTTPVSPTGAPVSPTSPTGSTSTPVDPTSPAIPTDPTPTTTGPVTSTPTGPQTSGPTTTPTSPDPSSGETSEPPGPGTELPEPVWIGAWGTAPQLTEENNKPPTSLVNNTLRQIIFPTLSGTKVRLELSNGWGNGPLELKSVHLAKAGEAAGSIDAATDTALTFSGQASVTIPAKETVWSDPVDFNLTALERVAITMQLGANVPAEFTGHPGSRTDSYIVTGDAVASATLNSPTVTTHWYYITKIDTQTTDPKSGAIVAFGDSITDGRGSEAPTPNLNQRWPDYLARSLQTNEATKSVSVLNMGIGGNAILTGGLGPTGKERFARDVLGQSRVKYLILFHGINDINANATAAALIEAYSDFVEQARAAGIKVYGVPLLPFYNPGSPQNQNLLSAHEAVNTWVRTPGNYDAVIDFEDVVKAPNSNPPQLKESYQNDYLHPTAALYRAMGESIDLSLFTSAAP
jgi:lysophospholipase L1-like esterase